MKSVPQHACDECNELIEEIGRVLGKMHAAKRLGSLQEMQIELSALEMEMGSVRAKAREMKAFVTRAVAQACVREYSDVVVARPVGMWPEHCGTGSTDNGVRVGTENGSANH